MKSIIIGAGTYGEVYLAYLQEAGVEVVGFLDDDPKYEGKNVRELPVLGKVTDLVRVGKSLGVEAVYCPLGNNKLRVEFLERARTLGFKTPNYIHPSVKIALNVKIASEGVYILQGSELMPYVTLEKDVMISAGANIVHHSYLSQGTFVSNGVNFGANVHSEKYAYCGMGCTIMTGVHTLGEDCLIGAGAVVIRDVEPNAVMAGVPAKVIKYKNTPKGLRGG
ncbi:MAG: acetyltransferase [Prevotella sp.]